MRLGAVGAGLGAFDRDALGATGVVRRQYQRVTIATTMPKMAHASATSHSFVIGEIPSLGAVASTGPSTSSAGGPGVVVGTAASVALPLSLVPTFAPLDGLTPAAAAAAVVGVAVVDFGRAPAAVVGAAALVVGGAFAVDVVAVGLAAATGFVVGVVVAVVAVLGGAVDAGPAGFAVVGAAVVGVAIVAALAAVAAVATPAMQHPEVSASAISAARPPDRRVGRLKMGTQAPGDEFRPLPTREGTGSPPPTRGCSRPRLAPLEPVAG